MLKASTSRKSDICAIPSVLSQISLRVSSDKMLRHRIRQWRINTKNKRSMSRAGDQDGTRASPYNEKDILQTAVMRELQRPIPISSEEAPQRLLLSTIDQYFEHAWEVDLEEDDGLDAVNLLVNVDNAIVYAANNDSKYGWAFLRKAEMELQQRDWCQLSPRCIIALIGVLGIWLCEPTELESNLRRLVKGCVSNLIGERHPMVIMMEMALCGKLNLETCQICFAMAEARAASNTSDSKEMEVIHRATRTAHLGMLWHLGEFEKLVKILDSWSPTNAHGKLLKLRYLAEAKTDSGEYEEADRLFSIAIQGFSSQQYNAMGLHNLIKSYVQSLVDRNRPKEAVEVFLDGLSRYEEAAKDSDVITPKLDALRLDAEWCLGDCCDSEGLDQVMRKLDAMTLDTCIS